MKIFKLGKKRSKVENGYSVDPHSLKKLDVLQNKINYNFKDVCLLLEALTHPSYDLKKSDTPQPKTGIFRGFGFGLYLS